MCKEGIRCERMGNYKGNSIVSKEAYCYCCWKTNIWLCPSFPKIHFPFVLSICLPPRLLPSLSSLIVIPYPFDSGRWNTHDCSPHICDRGPYINDVGQNQEIPPPPPCRTSSVETYPPPPIWDVRIVAAFNLNHPPPSPFLPTLTSTPAIIYKNTEILYTSKSSTYVQIIKLICRGFKFSQIGWAKIEGAPIIWLVLLPTYIFAHLGVMYVCKEREQLQQ